MDDDSIDSDLESLGTYLKSRYSIKIPDVDTIKKDPSTLVKGYTTLFNEACANGNFNVA